MRLVTAAAILAVIASAMFVVGASLGNSIPRWEMITWPILTANWAICTVIWARRATRKETISEPNDCPICDRYRA